MLRPEFSRKTRSVMVPRFGFSQDSLIRVKEILHVHSGLYCESTFVQYIEPSQMVNRVNDFL